MKTLVLYYSYMGHTKALAEALALKEVFDICEIKDVKRPSILGAFIRGGYAAITKKSWPIEPLTVDPAAYEHIILCAPVWGSNLPPAVNAALANLPADITVSVKMVSGSGKSACKEKIEALITGKGSSLKDFEDIKA